VLKICRAEACQAAGGAALAEATLARLGLDWHGTTADGAVTVEPVYCLGLCACAPAAMLDGRVLGRVDAARMDAFWRRRAHEDLRLAGQCRQGCGDGVAQDFLLVSNGKPFTMRQGRRNTSSATPMKVTAAHSPTG
jgi:hypothetical protein